MLDAALGDLQSLLLLGEVMLQLGRRRAQFSLLLFEFQPFREGAYQEAPKRYQNPDPR